MFFSSEKCLLPPTCAFSVSSSDRRLTTSCPQRSQRSTRLHPRRRCRCGERIGRDGRTRLHPRRRRIAGCSHRTCAMSTRSSPPYTKRYGNLVRITLDFWVTEPRTTHLRKPRQALCVSVFLAQKLMSTPHPRARRLLPLRAHLRALLPQETAQKRLVLAAAALPVLQVPLHAFSLVVPYLVAMLEAFSPKAIQAKQPDVRKKRNNTDISKGGATAAVNASSPLLRQERGSANTRREGRRQWPDEPEDPTASTGLFAPVEPAPPIDQGESQPSRQVAAAVAPAGSRPTVPEDAQASAQAEPPEPDEAATHAAAWVSVFDLSAARLGPSLAAEVLLPSVLATLER